MNDINAEVYNRTGEQYSLAMIMGQASDAGRELLAEMEKTVPNYFAMFLKNLVEILERPECDLSDEQQNTLFSSIRMLTAYMTKVLMNAQEGAEVKDERQEQIEKQAEMGDVIVESLSLYVTKRLIKGAEDHEDARKQAENGEGKIIETVYRPVPSEHWPIYPKDKFEQEGSLWAGDDSLGFLFDEGENEEPGNGEGR